MAEHKCGTASGNPPINQHPLFPAIVALWFGALFGLCSIAIPAASIESVVTATGIDRVIPMAAPPLGTTARILIALAMTAVGAGLGALLGLRLARAPEQVRTRRRSAMTGEVAAAAPRWKAVAKDAPLPVEPAKASGGEATPAVSATVTTKRGAKIFNVAALGEDEPESALATAAPSSEEPALSVGAHDLSIGVSPGEPSFAAQNGPTPPLANSLFETYSRDITPCGDSLPEVQAHSFFTPDEADVEEANLQVVSDAHNLQENGDEEPAPHFTDGVYAEDSAVDADATASVSRMPSESRESPSGRLGHMAAERIVSAELDELSPLELLERLALAMERRRAAHASFPPEAEVDAHPVLASPEPAPAIEPEPAAARIDSGEPVFEVAAEEEAEPSRILVQPEDLNPLPFAPPTIPAALRPVALGDDDDMYEEPLPGYIPPRHIGQTPSHLSTPLQPALSADPLATPDDEDDDAETDELLEGGYSSLLDLSRSAVKRASPLQWSEDEMTSQADAAANSEDENLSAPFDANGHETLPEEQTPYVPVSAARPFDGPAGSADPAETERALRAALATLQRMSGAA